MYGEIGSIGTRPDAALMIALIAVLVLVTTLGPRNAFSSREKVRETTIVCTLACAYLAGIFIMVLSDPTVFFVLTTLSVISLVSATRAHRDDANVGQSLVAYTAGAVFMFAAGMLLSQYMALVGAILIALALAAPVLAPFLPAHAGQQVQRFFRKGRIRT